jgi:hypothetical protein
MTDITADIAELRDEVAHMPRTLLQEAVRAGSFPVHPWRAGLDTPERLAAARQRVADLRRAPVGEVGRTSGSRDPKLTRATIVARQTGALAQVWQTLAGRDDAWFHLRRVDPPTPDLRVSWARREAPRTALDANPGAPLAPYLEHPISVEEAARFAVVLPLLRGCSALATTACRALDAIGQPTTALHRWAESSREPPSRRAVWRRANPARADRPGFRMVTLTAAHVLAEVQGRARPEYFGLPAALHHPSEWSRLAAVVLGALAWRSACERDARIQRPTERAGHRLHLRAAAVGRRYRELEDPFVPLLAILRLGCCLYACSPATMTLELTSPLRAPGQ